MKTNTNYDVMKVISYYQIDIILMYYIMETMHCQRDTNGEVQYIFF